MGLVRDSTLNATNDAVLFEESFDSAAKVGVESLAITATVRPDGAVAGTVAPAA